MKRQKHFQINTIEGQELGTDVLSSKKLILRIKVQRIFLLSPNSDAVD